MLKKLRTANLNSEFTGSYKKSVFKIMFLSRNLDQNMPKNAYSFEKSFKIAAASGAPSLNPRWPPATEGFSPRPPRCYFHLLLQLC